MWLANCKKSGKVLIFKGVPQLQQKKKKEMIMILSYPLEPNKEQLWKFQIIYITFPARRDVSKYRIWAKNELNSFIVITQLLEEFLGRYFKFFYFF